MRALRIAAWTVVAAGVAAPAMRRRMRLSPPVVTGAAAAAPFALCVVVPRTRARDAAVCGLQMWAYTANYKMPHDDPEAQARRVAIDYPIAIDRALGLGELPTVRLQRAFAPRERFRAVDKALVWTHWMWFAVPHGSIAYLLLRRPDLFERGAAMMYATFDLGAVAYWALPTAPPWYAVAGEGRAVGQDPAAAARRVVAGQTPVRRMMAEYGELFWRDRWGPLYSVFGGNPLAAMPSLHFATSVMAATLLWQAGLLAGAAGWGYALALGFALVYLGEHYVIDLVAGVALALAVRRSADRFAPALARVGRAVARLEAWAH